MESGICGHLRDVMNAGWFKSVSQATSCLPTLSQITLNTAARRHTIEMENNSRALPLIPNISSIVMQ